MMGVAASAIRFWQHEFWPHVRPVRTGAKQHVFSRRDVQVLGLIRTLVRDRGLSIREAKARLADLISEGAFPDPPVDTVVNPIEAAVSRDIGDETDGLRIQIQELREALEAARRRTAVAEDRIAVLERDMARHMTDCRTRLARARLAIREMISDVVGPGGG